MNVDQQLKAEFDLLCRGIARELHDIVAHNVSVMVVQAEAADEMRSDSRTFASSSSRFARIAGVAGLAFFTFFVLMFWGIAIGAWLIAAGRRYAPTEIAVRVNT